MGQGTSGDHADQWGPTNESVAAEVNHARTESSQFDVDAGRKAVDRDDEANPTRVGVGTAPLPLPLPGMPPMAHPAMPPPAAHSEATVSYLKRLLAQAEAVVSHSSAAEPNDAAMIRHQLDAITRTAQRQQAKQQQTIRAYIEDLARAQQQQQLESSPQAAASEDAATHIGSPSPARPTAVAASVLPSSRPEPKKARRSAHPTNGTHASHVVRAQVAPIQAVTRRDATQAVVVAHAPTQRRSSQIHALTVSQPEASPTRTGSQQEAHTEMKSLPTHQPLQQPQQPQHAPSAQSDESLPSLFDFSTPSLLSPHTDSNEKEWMVPSAEVEPAFTHALDDSSSSLPAADAAPYAPFGNNFREYDPMRSSDSPQFGHTPAALLDDELVVPDTPIDLFYALTEEPSHDSRDDNYSLPHSPIGGADAAAASSPVSVDSTASTSETVSTSKSAIQASVRGAHTLPADRMSKVFLRNYLNADLLKRLESEHAAGRFSTAAVRQYIMWATASLQEEEQSELLEQFTRLNLRGCEEALFSCPHVDLHPMAGVPCCPRKAMPGWGGNTIRSMRQVCRRHPTDPLSLTPAQRELIAEGKSIPPPCRGAPADDPLPARTLIEPSQVDQDLSPSEAAPDDSDGVARMRLTMLFSMPAKLKRRLHAEDDEPEEANTNDDTSSEPTVHVHRRVQINRAFESLHGFTQADVKSMLRTEKHDPTRVFSQVRSDFVAACHAVATQRRLEGITEGHMFQVRHINGREVYCLVHSQVHENRGLFLGVVHSFMPLPDDPDHPPPPFVEGVDIDIDTVLYGYRPNRSTTM